MKNFLIILFFLIGSFELNAQVILLQEDVIADTITPTEGPNRDRYKSTYTSFGLLFGPTNNHASDILPYFSYNVQSGARLKLKINKVLSWGLESYFDFKSFRIKQSDEKTFGGEAPSLHKKETFFVVAYDLAIFTRINFDPKRGDFLGTYLDLGAYGGYNFLRRHKIVDTVNNQFGFEKGKYIASNLKYVEKFNYGVTARFGFGGMSVYFNYRLSNLFKPFRDINYVELPRFEAGISFDVQSYKMRDNYAHRRNKR